MFKTIVVIIFCLALLLPGLSKPFVGHHDWNGVFYSQISRNYLKHGLETKLGQMTSPGNFYTHYPPLFPWMLGLDFKLFGVGESQARLLPVLLTVLSFVLLVKLTNSLAPLLLLFTPMIRYFSHMPSQEALMVFLALLTVNFYRSRKVRPLLITVALLGWSGWAGYFLIPLLWLHAHLYKPKFRPVLFKAVMILVGTFGLHSLHTFWLTGSVTGGGLLDALLLRLNLFPAMGRIEPELAGQFTWLNYLNKQFHTLNIFYTSTILLLAAIGIGFLLYQSIKRRRLQSEQALILALLLWGLAYPLIFSNVVFVHEYFNLFFWPGLAFAIAYLFKSLSKKWFYPTLVLLALIVMKERQPFLSALFATEAFRPGYELGLQVNQASPPGETVTLPASAEFVDVQGIFVEYYADRPIIWDNNGNE